MLCAGGLEIEQRMARRAAAEVAQIFNLSYRRIVFGSVSDRSDALAPSDTSQITNLRYGRVQLCATPSDFVLRIWDLHVHFPARLFA